jgi:hypothetical protein
LYNQRQQKLKWKDPRTFNAKTQAHTDASELGVKESYGPRWPCKFKLYELDV